MTHLVVDYLVLSFKKTSFFNYLTEKYNFNLSEMITIKSYYGCADCTYFDGIKIHLDIDDNIVILDMSGKGCRTFEHLNPGLDWYDFLHQFDSFLTVKDKESDCYLCHIARLDIACDLIGEHKINLDFLQKYVNQNKFVCKSKFYSCVNGNREKIIYFGSPASDRRLRIYDKCMEQGNFEPWVRFEFQLRNDNALSFYLNLVKSNGNWSFTYCGILHDYLRFVTKSKDTEKHYDRLNTCQWWLDFLNDIEQLKQLYLDDSPYYSPVHLYNYIEKQCASSIKTFLKLHNDDVLPLLDLIKHADLNSKQRELLEKYVIINDS